MTQTDPAPPVNLMDRAIYAEDREMPVFDSIRADDPVFWNPPSEDGPGFWALTRYEDVKAAASDHLRLSSAGGTQIVDRKVEGKLASLHNMDDPEHAKLRKLTVSHLRAVKIREWQDAIDESVARVLDAAERVDGPVDVVRTISSQLPMLVLARVLGVPAEDGPKMVDWTNRLTSSDPADAVDEGALADARDEVMAYFRELTGIRRAEPQNDLISILVQGKKDGVLLTWDELAAYIILLVAAGNETTRHSLSGGMMKFAEQPETWERLRKDPSLFEGAIEEILRWVTAVAAMRRTALEPLTIGGKQIAAGDKVVLWFSAANRDPEVFDSPHDFVIDRKSNDHLSFGWGVHFCLGAHLARAELTSFFTEAARRGISFELAGTPVRIDYNIFRGWTELPMRLVK